MPRTHALGAVSATALLLAAGPALADVTAQQVWDDWSGYLKQFGYDVEGQADMSGDTLTVSDASASFELPEDGGTVKIEMGDIVLTEQGDGTVSVAFADNVPMMFDLHNADPDEDTPENVKMTLDYALGDLNMIVSGDADNATYDYSADQVGLKLADLVVDGQEMDEDQANFSLTLRDLEGSSVSSGGEPSNIEQTLTASRAEYDVAFTNPEDDSTFSATGGLDDLTFSGNSAFPADIDMEKFAEALKAGFSVKGSYGYKNGTTDFSFNDGDNGKTTGTTSVDEARIDVTLNGDTLAYGGNASNMHLAMASDTLPFPVDVSLATTAFNLSAPLAAADEPQPFKLSFELGDLAINDELWSLFDPGKKLPRDPATVALDLDGTVTLDKNLTDPGVMDADTPPGQLESVNLNSLRVSVGGAELTGNGGFTFDNSDTETFDGMPKPTGSVDFKAVGINALMDKLVDMGLLPEQQAMGARMMMGMFTVPAGDDTLTSNIEIEDGHIKANGQRIR